MNTAKTFINEVISIKYNDWEEPISGMVIDYNEDWTLLAKNPNDYMHDGYIIVNHQNLDGYKKDEMEELVEKVFKMKGIDKNLPTLSLDDVETILNHLSKEYQLFSIQLATQEESCYVGIVRSISNGQLALQSIDIDGRWDEDEELINLKEIRTIEFDTDYLRSLLMLNKPLK